MFEDLKYNEDYTSVINERHYERINELVADAKEKGAEVLEINPADEDFEQQELHKIPPTLVRNVNDDMEIMHEEIFGPVLPIKTYQDINETTEYVNSKDRPLGLYYFGEDKKELDDILKNTTSGGVTINDVVFHVAQDNAPFGGVGPSGTGSYHGIEGFKNFSHAKTIYTQTKIDGLINIFRPPYGTKAKKALKMQIKP